MRHIKTLAWTAALAGAGALASPALAEDAGFDCSGLIGAAVVHFQGPYTQQLLSGAEAAVNECGGTFRGGGPAAFDTSAEVSIFQDFVLAGAKAIVVVAYPSDFWIRIIDDAVKQGVAVSTFDVEAPASLELVHTAPKQKDQGRAMADVLADKLGDAASGKVVIGICLPGLDLIEARIVGFKERMTERLPNVELIGPLDVKFDQTENYSQWRSVVDANPGALAYVGYCENDLPSLVRIKEQDNGSYEIGSIGLNPDGLSGIAKGTALVAIGQKPFMQGYVAMRAMLQKLAAGESVPRGWIDVQPEVVTADNVAAVTEREASLANGTGPTREYYAKEIEAIFSDLDGNVQSFGALLGD